MKDVVGQLQRVTVDPDQCRETSIHLTASQHHYLCHVLRLPSGATFIALDGRGRQWLARLTADPGLATIVQPLPQAAAESPQRLILMMALPKQGFDEVVRQVTELGVTEIWPVISDRTLLRPSAQKCDRWRRIAQEAAEQSERLVVPQIRTPQALSACLQEPLPHSWYWSVARQDAPHLLTRVHQRQPAGEPLTLGIAIGPEGGWTAAETVLAINQGAEPVSLGRGILRAVTAAVVAIALVHSVWEADAGIIAVSDARYT